MSRSIDLAAGAIEIALQVLSLPATQAISGTTVDTLLGANRGFVGAQSIQFSACNLILVSSGADPRDLPVLSRVDSGSLLRGRVVAILRKCDDRGREREPKHRRNDRSNHRSPLLHGTGYWVRPMEERKVKPRRPTSAG